MATNRPFARNLGANIAGTEQLGELAIGNPNDHFSETGLDWYGGPDEDLGYVIAKENPSGQSAADGSTAYLGFWRSDALTEASFIELGNNLLGGNYTSGAQVKTALNTAGYWTSFTGAEELDLQNPIVTSNNEYISLGGQDYLAHTTGGTPVTGLTVTVQEVEGNVVWSYSGSLDLSGLTPAGSGNLTAGFNAGMAIWAVGPHTETTVDIYNGVTIYPSSMGTPAGIGSYTGTGDLFGIVTSGVDRDVRVSTGYVSNTPISGSTTYTSQTIAGMGFTEGTYTYSWGSGTNQTVTLIIGGGNNGGGGETGSTGEWSFYSDEGALNAPPPISAGQIMIIDNDPNGTIETYDPNYPGHMKFISVNLLDSASNSFATQFAALQSNGGSVSLSQNGQTATYVSMAPGEFFVDPNGFLIIPTAIQTVTTAGPFVAGTPITLTIN